MAASEGARIEGSSPFTVSQPLNNQLVGTSLMLLRVKFGQGKQQVFIFLSLTLGKLRATHSFTNTAPDSAPAFDK